MKISDFDYYLPDFLIAQKPLKNREFCRMLHLDKNNKTFFDEKFFDIEKYLKKDDILVLNDTKVYPARVLLQRSTGASIEVFFLNRYDNLSKWEVLMKNAKRLKQDEILQVSDDFRIKYIKKLNAANENEIPHHIVEVEFKGNDFYEVLNKYGSIPLPPYIKRKTEKDDAIDYQTVFAKNTGSVASPTAGLHFSKELLNRLKQNGIKIAYITLNVGLGTFMPVKVDNIEKHTMHHEYFSIPKETEKIFSNKPDNASVIAAGTTVVRCLEATYQKYGKIIANSDKTDIFIYPPYKIKSIDKLITNFHLPKSTLIMLVSAFCGKDFTLKSYNYAVEKEYRFFSYGDCMFIE